MMQKLVITLAVVGLLLLLIKRKNMTTRQSVVKVFYPVLIQMGKWFGGSNVGIENKNSIVPFTSFYDLSATALDGRQISFSQFKGKKILIVNTASDCGYTPQLEDLEKLQKQFKNELVVLGFPANDFKDQEKGANEEIEAFCKKNYGVTFPLMEKTSALIGAYQHPVYQWLTDKKKNGWNDKAPTWNFCKYLINEKGVLMYYFSSGVSPLDEVITSKI